MLVVVVIVSRKNLHDMPDKKYFKCKSCNQMCNEIINGMKQHLASTHKDIKPYPKVPTEVQGKNKRTLKEEAKVK